MKRQFFGTICAVCGIVFASGDTISNGWLAIVFFGLAAIALHPAHEKSEQTIQAHKEARKAAARKRNAA